MSSKVASYSCYQRADCKQVQWQYSRFCSNFKLFACHHYMPLAVFNLLLFIFRCRGVGMQLSWQSIGPAHCRRRLNSPVRQGIFLPESTFCADSYGVRKPPFAIACIYICAHGKDRVVHVRAPQWGAADAEIKVPSGEITELKCSPFKAWSRSVYSHTCYAYCQGFLPCLFLTFRSIRQHFFQNLSRFFLCWLWLTYGSCVGPQNKIGHPAGCRFPCRVPSE